MELSIQKSSRFLLHFFIATNIANKPLSDCITLPKIILPFHFSPKPTAEGETKRQQSKQLQFHNISTKKKNIYRTPTIWRQSNLPSSICQFVPWSKLSNLSALHWTYQSQNPKAFKMHPQPNKLFQTYQNQLIFRLQVVTTLFKISVNHSTSAWVKFISTLLDNTIFCAEHKNYSKLHLYYKIRHKR